MSDDATKDHLRLARSALEIAKWHGDNANLTKAGYYSQLAIANALIEIAAQLRRLAVRGGE